MNNKGQSILSEYVMIFFVVVAAAVAATTYVQRGLEARMHDARNFAVDSLVNSGACDANCVKAAGGNVFYEYEPYYTQMASQVAQNQADFSGATTGNAQVLGAQYFRTSNESTASSTTSNQLDANCANGGC